jgi:hypothetical protein
VFWDSMGLVGHGLLDVVRGISGGWAVEFKCRKGRKPLSLKGFRQENNM